MADDVSLADYSAMMGSGQNNWFWIVILFLFMFGGKGFGQQTATDTQTVTQADLQRSVDTSSIMDKLNSIGQGLSSSGYENANLINGVNTNMQMGFAGLSNTMAQNTSAITASITDLGNQLQTCCCNLKSQMLQDKYDAVQTQLQQAQTVISNQTQTQTILNALGRYVANPPTPPVTTYTGTTI